MLRPFVHPVACCWELLHPFADHCNTELLRPIASNHDSPLQNLKSGLNVCSLHGGLGCICKAQKGHREIKITFTFVKLKYSEGQNSKEH